MEIIIASDGSTDRTNDIVTAYADAGVKLIAFDERNGKAFALNRSIPQASGDILLLTDSNTMYERDAVSKLVRHFRDPKVGGVCGELRVKPFDEATDEESLYWKFENFLKSMESPLNMTLGANGGVYAIRKDAFRQIPDGTIVDDFVIFLNVRKSRYKTLFDPEAVAFERSAPSLKDEYRRKVRIGAGDFQAIRLAGTFLDPRRGAVSFSFWSHKVLRWLVPFFLIGFLVSNVALARQSAVFVVFLILQLLFYALFVIGIFYRKQLYFKAPYYFVTMNMALLHGLVRYAFGRQKGTWQRTER
jgi:cellulose synthase/poly-beta-1,6-N-acetylglucosamine synthase-like glycosyltransferase